MLKSGAVTLAAILAMACAQAPNPYYSVGGGGGPPPGVSPYSGLGGPPSSSSFGGPSSSSPYSFGGPPSSSPYSFGGPSSASPYSFGGPSSRPFASAKKPPRSGGGSKLFSYLSQMSKGLSGLVPKVQFHSSKPPKPSSFGGPASLSGLSLGASGRPPPQTYFSSSTGGPSSHSLILPQIPNSIFESSSSPFGPETGSTVSFAPSNSVDHPPVIYSRPGGPPSSSPYRGRPGGPPPFGTRPSFSPGGSRSPFSPSPYAPSESPFGISSSPSSRPPPYSGPQGVRNNLEVFPSQQLSYQSQTLTQNQPGYNDALSGIQNLYASQNQPSGNKPSYAPLSAFEQQSSYTQAQPVKSANNYGAVFHNVQVAPIYDIAQHYKPSGDLSGAGSAPQRHQQQQQISSGNIHDTPFASLVNDYAQHADAATAGSEQMMSALESAGADLMSSASSNQPIQGIQILGNAEGNPMFEVVADANAPTFDGHPVDLNKLISMIEPGAQIDTIPSYAANNADAQMGSETAGSEQQPVFMHPPSPLELESDAAMASGILSGNKRLANNDKNKIKLVAYQPLKSYHLKDRLEAASSETRPTVVKLDGTRLNDDTLIKEHFDKDLILDVNDDLQESNDEDKTGYIVVGLRATDDDNDNQTGDDDEQTNNNKHLQAENFNNNRNTNSDDDLNINNTETDKDLLAIIQQLRNSALVTSSSFDLDKSSELVEDSGKVTNQQTNIYNNNVTESPHSAMTTEHPNHNYNPAPMFHSEVVESTTQKLSPINHIVDHVRPGRTMSIRTSVKKSVTESDGDQEPSASRHELHLIDKDTDDDDAMFPDLIESGDEDDLAMSASRNVKSVAIIVTPPPHYVKIKNKYKKVVTPRSWLTSTTSPATVEENKEGLTGENDGNNDSSNINNNDDNPFSESFSEENRSIINTTPRSSSLELNSNNGNDRSINNNYDNGEYEDEMLKLIRGFSNGSGGGRAIVTTTPSSLEGGRRSSVAIVPRPRLYPVYRRKSA